MKSSLKVLFLAAEADPFIKVGGLGDVAGSLPQALHAASGIDVRLVIPLYGGIRERLHQLQTIAIFDVPNRSGAIQARVYTTRLNGLIVYFVSGDPIPLDANGYSMEGMAKRHPINIYLTVSLISQLTFIATWVKYELEPQSTFSGRRSGASY